MFTDLLRAVNCFVPSMQGVNEAPSDHGSSSPVGRERGQNHVPQTCFPESRSFREVFTRSDYGHPRWPRMSRDAPNKSARHLRAGYVLATGGFTQSVRTRSRQACLSRLREVETGDYGRVASRCLMGPYVLRCMMVVKSSMCATVPRHKFLATASHEATVVVGTRVLRFWPFVRASDRCPTARRQRSIRQPGLPLHATR